MLGSETITWFTEVTENTCDSLFLKWQYVDTITFFLPFRLLAELVGKPKRPTRYPAVRAQRPGVFAVRDLCAKVLFQQRQITFRHLKLIISIQHKENNTQSIHFNIIMKNWKECRTGKSIKFTRIAILHLKLQKRASEHNKWNLHLSKCLSYNSLYVLKWGPICLLDENKYCSSTKSCSLHT